MLKLTCPRPWVVLSTERFAILKQMLKSPIADHFDIRLIQPCFFYLVTFEPLK